MGAVDTVAAEVRELVRRRGLDPVIDRAAMRRWVEEVVTGHDAQALTSASPAISHLRTATRVVYDSRWF